ncbi:A/G-specific adenine glycosylase [Rhizorhabdus dicambivorans]|uniref:Adenine DNA glycosylase n=1 Tax=Rhizorhabdus dicambivorans TaxID=1850238 RepID=A0A2A4FZZ9_9SPHN|nr:A/G-specific adenine glycosylase [Rhizorhabdus dicambivorans]ATE65903.1 A/G-specific adenine glycosylase [Rhizorhabdus dicambivorans]PCE43017.1 A/G-specific adenine glycosylase [Rhizorhabdus dicambivorans]
MPVDAVPEKLLNWYDAHHRRLPWRAGPGEPRAAPYRVWLSEVMLQQTTVAAVKSYYAHFTTRWPTVADLAAADEAEVMAAWAGLGYYARARNLIACARAVVNDHGGAFPDSEAGLRTLPGIGDYSAAAIAAIAFGRRAVVVDANVERVTSRLFAFDGPLPVGRPAIRELADRITPDERAGDFAQAMMDLGSSICTVRNPQCLICPLHGDCAARAAGNPEAYPVKAPKKAKPQRRGTAFWIERDGHVWLVRRPAKGMLGGMRALPTGPWTDADPGLAEAPAKADWVEAGSVDHVFTHFALRLRVVTTRKPAPLNEGEWWPIARIEEAGLPTLFARAAARAIAAAQD